MNKVFISKIGIITALGNDAASNLQALLSGQDALTFPEILATKHTDFRVGEIKLTNSSLIEILNITPQPIGNRSAYLAIWAIKELLNGIDKSLYQSDRIAFINATTVGSMSETEKIYQELLSSNNITAKYNPQNQLDCAACTQEIAAYFGFKGFMTTISTACSSAANAIQMGAKLIQQGIYDKVICGGTDALSRFTLNGFNALKNIDKSPCIPFDQNRKGLNLGEGAGYLLLQSEQSLAESGISPMAVLSGYASTNEAHHPTAPSPDGKGATDTMQKALISANLPTQKISYINAHGTATLGNDLSEANAIKTVFGSNPPPFVSTKCFTGHTLAASGSIEAIFSTFSIMHNFIPANLRFQNVMEETGLSPNTTLQTDKNIQHVLTNSFGFGGSNVSLIISAL